MLDATHCSKEHSLYECERPCDALSCLFCSSLWLGCNQSILVQETQPAKDIDLTCFKTFPIEATTCLQVGPMSLEWPVDPFAGFDHSRCSLSPEVPSDDQRRGALPASTRSRWRQDTLQPSQVLHHIACRDTCGHFPDAGLRCITWNTKGSRWICLSSQKHWSLSYVSRRFTERMSISKLFRCWLRDLGFFVTFIPGNENAGDRPYASTRNFCLRMLL